MRSLSWKYFLILFLCCCCSYVHAARFALLTDLHVSPGTPNDAALGRVVDEINRGGYDFAVVSGDISNQGTDAELETVKKRLSGLRLPYYLVPGNHETNWSESAGLTINRLWGGDRFLFRSGKWLFVGFNTGPYMKMGDGHVKAEDILWMDKVLQSELKEGERPVFIAHYPANEWLSNGGAVIALMKKYRAAAMFFGHGHALRAYNLDGIPGVMGRALYMPKDRSFGYTVVEMNGDRFEIYEKKLGEPLSKVVYAFGAGETFDDLPPPPPPAPPGGRLPDGWSEKLILSADASIFTGLAFRGTVLYYGTSTGELRAYDWKKQKALWTLDLGGTVHSTPLYGCGVVIAGSIGNEIAGVDADTGKVLWKLPARAPVINDGLIHDGFLYMGLGKGEFCKIDVKTGRKIWSWTGVQGIFQAQPAVVGGRVVFGAWDRHLYCLNESDGSLLWSWNNGHPQKLYSPGNCVPVISCGKVFLVAPDRFMTALDLRTGRQLWRSGQFSVRESQCGSVDGKRVYGKTMNGLIIAVDADAPEYRSLWNVDAKFGYEHNPCPLLEHDGIVFAGSRQGILAAADAGTRRLLWTYKCGNSSINKIAAGPDGGIWVTLIEGKIYRFFRDGK